MSSSRSVPALTNELKRRAADLGFDACGISKAERLDEEALRLESWLLAGKHASMSWMERNFDKRVDPRELVPGAKSVVSIIAPYFQEPDVSPPPGTGRISRYAWGEDYHHVLKRRLKELFEWLRDEAGDVGGRIFVDSAPVMDKAWAARSGLGWIGKHTNLLSRDHGSWFFIGEMIVDIALTPDGPTVDHCGSCTRCIDACPTDALYEPYVIDSNRCISYLTIEHRTDDIDPALQANMENWVFGCDVCQEVCPWNKYRRTAREEAFAARDGVIDSPIEVWERLSETEFAEQFRETPVLRTRYEGFARNVRIAGENIRRD